jgi:N-methylhydantoinase B
VSVTHGINVQGCRNRLLGFAGGEGGAGNWVIIDWGGPNETYVDELAMNYESRPGELILYQSGGGGGWGPAVERDPVAVLTDVLNEFVSVEGARASYGVVIDPETMQVLEAETAELRGQMRSGEPTVAA